MFYYTILMGIWIVLSAITIYNLISYIEEISWWKQPIVYLVIIISLPFGIITEACNQILDWLLPEGWADDDYYY